MQAEDEAAAELEEAAAPGQQTDRQRADRSLISVASCIPVALRTGMQRGVTKINNVQFRKASVGEWTSQSVLYGEDTGNWVNGDHPRRAHPTIVEVLTMKLQKFALAAICVFVLAAGAVFAGCGENDSGSDSSSGEGGKIALLLPESKTARYETQDRPLFTNKVEGALRRLRGHLQQRRPGRSQAAAAGRSRADPGRRGARARPGRRRIGGDDRQAGQGQERAGDQLRPPDRLRATSTTTSRSTTRRSANCRPTALKDKMGDKGTIVMINGAPTDNNAKLFKAGRAQRLRRERHQDRQGVRHAGLVAGQGPERDGAGDHRARQGRLPGRLRRQRRNCRWRDRRDEVGRNRLRRPPDHRTGRRARSDPADPRRDAVHDDLQGDQARGRAGRASSRSRWPHGNEPDADADHRRDRRRRKRRSRRSSSTRSW